MTAKVAINGFGRIGRAAFKIALDTPELGVVAVNDIAPLHSLAYLLKYDTVYGRYERSVETDEHQLVVDGEVCPVFSERDPAQLPWDELGVDIVFECTGVFTNEESLHKHLEAGADYVLLSAPPKGEEISTIVHGVSASAQPSDRIISCASCTTNSIAPVVEVMARRIGIEKAIMTTIHGYTSSQSIVDAPNRKIRRGRAAAANLVPTTTGAAKATTKVLPEHQRKFDGVAVRAPVPVGSISDIVFVTSRTTSAGEVNRIFRQEVQTPRYRGVLAATEEPIVSSDIIKQPYASIVDLGMTQVVDGDLVKVMSWYDNEWGFTSQMIRRAVDTAKMVGLA